ncbi:MAG: hypothetical protein ABI208_08765 [Ginsengibacter sp.]|jgi:hypothetical protein
MEKIVQNIYDDILELSDLNLQKKLWLNDSNDTGQISSYVEVMCRLFDDNDFNGFVEQVTVKIGLPVELISELIVLRTLLQKYNEKESDAKIIMDPKWNEIVEQAKLVIKKWNKIGRNTEAI